MKHLHYVLLIIYFLGLSDSKIQGTGSSRDLLNRSIRFQQHHQMDSAGFYAHTALKSAVNENDMKLYCDAALRLSSLCVSKQSYDSARFWDQKVVEISHKNNWKKTEAMAYSSLGTAALRQEHLLTSVSLFQKAYKMLLDAGDEKGTSFTIYNLALTYSQLDDLQNAFLYSKKALSQAQKNNNADLKMGVYHLMARLYRMKHDQDSADYYNKLSLSIQKREDLLPYYLTLANRLKNRKKTDSAIYFYDSALAIAAQNRDTISQLNILISKAMTNLDARKPMKALSLLRQVQQHEMKLEGRIDMAIYYETFANAWKLTGQSDSALYYTEKLMAAKDNNHVRQRQKYLMELRVKYQAKKKENELINLKNKILKGELEESTRKIQLNTLLGSSFTLLLIIILLIWFYFYKHKKDKKIREQEVAFLQKEKEATVAQSLLKGEENERKRIASELHDGLGVLLSSVSIFFSNLEEDSDPERGKNLQNAKELVNKANVEVRRISHNLMPMVLSRFGLKATLEDMVDKVSGDLNINLSVKVGQGLPESMEFMLYRLTQELLNNTLKHAEATEITISCLLKGDYVLFEYKDNGKGFDMKTGDKEDGIGLSSIRNRVEFLKGSMKFQSEPRQGVKVEIIFPYR